MISFPVRLSEKQHSYLAEVKEEHGISMAAQIRTMIQRDMYGLGGRSEIRREDSVKRTRPVQVGSSGYSACVRELTKVFAVRHKRGGRG